MKYIYSAHADEQMRYRKISRKDVQNVITKGKKWFCPTDNRWHAKMGGIEVVYEKEEGAVIVVTCFHERWF